MSFTEFQTTDSVINTRMNLFGNEIMSQVTKYSTYDLYLKAGNLMNTQKPTGAGSLVTFANVTETEQLAFTFNYAIPERLIISTDNKYNLVMPFQGLESNRSYIFRYVYKHEGTTIFDITRNAVSTATGNFTVEFQALNQNTVDIIAEANTTVSLQIYVRAVAGTDTQIALLVNDVNALGRLSRNEATAIISADNVLMPDGVTPISSAIGQNASDLELHISQKFTNIGLITEPWNQTSKTTIDLGYRPKSIIIEAVIQQTNYVSIGSFSDVSPTGQFCMFYDVSLLAWNSAGPSITFRQNASNVIAGTISFTATGFEITWAFTGTLPAGTGNRRIVYTAFAH